MNRNTGLAVVHIAKKELGMDTAEYREFLKDNTGKNSAADFNPVEMRKVIRALEARGFRLKTTERSRSAMYDYQNAGCRDAADTKSLIRVIKKLWHQVSRSVDEQASLRRFIFKRYHVQELEGLRMDQLKDVYDRLRSYAGARW